MIGGTGQRAGIRWRERIIRGILVGLTVSIVVLLIVGSDVFFSLRMQLNDTYFIPRPASDRIVIVALDDASLERFGRSLANWPRTIYATAVERLAQAGARVIAFDVLFAETDSEFRDTRLEQALESARGGEARTRLVMPAVGLTPDLENSGGGLLAYDTVLLPLARFRAVIDYVGIVNVLPDSDNVIRRQISRARVPLQDADPGETDDVLYGFSIATYLAYLRLPAAAASQVVTPEADTLNIGQTVSLPVDRNGIWRQNFFSPPSPDRPTFDIISFASIIDDNFDRALIADRIVLIGVINSTGSGDRYPVPFARDGRLVSGVEIHAHAIETLLQNQPVETQPLPAAIVTFGLLSLGFSLIYSLVRWYVVIPLAALGLIAWLVLCSLLFESERLIIDLFPGALAVTLPAVGHVLWKARDERVLRRRSELSLAVVEAILDGTPGAVLVLDSACRVRRVNRAFTRHISASALPGQPFEALVKTLPLTEEARSRLITALKGAQPFKLELKLGEKTYNAEGAPVDAPDGTRDWVILINDVSTLADLNRLRTQMLRMTSHDIRNPLNTILGFAELLTGEEVGEYDEVTKKEFLNYIISSAHDIKRILEGVLNLEKVRTETLTRESVSMGRIIEEVVDRLRASAESRRQTLTVTLSGGDLGVRGDPFQLHQAIFNLVENAIKYTREGGRIAVRAREEAGTIVIEVEDNGYGIPAEAQANIFKEFFRAVRGEAAGIRGTGLGLSLVKTIIDLHDGQISFTSIEGQGTTFTVRLPAFATAPASAPEPAHA